MHVGSKDGTENSQEKPSQSNSIGTSNGRCFEFFQVTLPAFFGRVAATAKEFFAKIGEFFSENAHWVWPVIGVVVLVASGIIGVVLRVHLLREWIASRPPIFVIEK